MISLAIKNSLRALEQQHNIRILFACESGSRAWGFPSPNSDYDVRFIYVHTCDWYLSIHEKRDVIELPIDIELDINGWELRKALRLVHKHNPILFEWMQSPIIYEVDRAFHEGFKKLAPIYFSPIAAMHHYLNSGKKYYEECISCDDIKLKKLFYSIRVTLAGLWIAHTKTIPPMELDKLLKIIATDKALVERIQALVQLKAAQPESYLYRREPEIENFLQESLSFCHNMAPSLPRSISDETLLNAFFRKMVA